AILRAQHESLLLHGLSREQADEIARTRTLRANLTVSVPGDTSPTERGASRADSAGSDVVYVVTELGVENGRLVSAGDPLLTLADYSELYIEGNAFEQDSQLLADALKHGRKVSATIENHSQSGTTVPELAMLYLSDQVDLAS